MMKEEEQVEIEVESGGDECLLSPFYFREEMRWPETASNATTASRAILVSRGRRMARAASCSGGGEKRARETEKKENNGKRLVTFESHFFVSTTRFLLLHRSPHLGNFAPFSLEPRWRPSSPPRARLRCRAARSAVTGKSSSSARGAPLARWCREQVRWLDFPFSFAIATESSLAPSAIRSPILPAPNGDACAGFLVSVER